MLRTHCYPHLHCIRNCRISGSRCHCVHLILCFPSSMKTAFIARVQEVPVRSRRECVCVSIGLPFAAVCKLPVAEFKCIQICGLFHSSLYFISCISENHLRFAYMTNFPFLVIKKDPRFTVKSTSFTSHQRKAFGFFSHSPLCTVNEDTREREQSR